MPENDPQPKVLFFDIESTGLNATFGTILCIGYKWLGESEVHVPTILDSRRKSLLDDKRLVEKFAKVHNWCDFSIGHYSSRYDLPMIRTKLLKYGLPPLAPKPHIDTWRIAKRELKLHSNRLAVLQEYLGTTAAKTPINFDDWLHAAHGNRTALARVVEHCRLDVLVLEEVYKKLRPLAREEPAKGLFVETDPETCPSCGSDNITRQGFRVSKTCRAQQFQCQDCGKWMRNRHSEKRADLVGN